MRRILSVLSLSVVLQVAVRPVNFAQTVPAIEGVVIEEGTNRPIAGARVILFAEPQNLMLFGNSIFSPPPATKTVVADSEGRFTVEDVTPGRYRMTPSQGGFVFSRTPRLKAARDPGVQVQVVAGQTVRGIELRMVREGIISGQVLDVNGQPIPGNTGSITLQRYTYDEYGIRQLTWVPGVSYPNAAGSFQRMNDRGEYRFYGLPPGDYYLSVSGSTVGSNGRVRQTTYYPGVLQENLAEPIHVDAGQEVRLKTITPFELSGPPLKLRFANPPSETSGVTVFIGQGSLIGTTPTAFGGPGKIELGAVATGHYDLQIFVGSFHSRVSLDVGTTEIDREITLTPGFAVQIQRFIEDANGQREPGAFGCGLRAGFGRSLPCSASRSGSMYVRAGISLMDLSRNVPLIPGGRYGLELRDTPIDAYVVSATANGRDVLRNGIEVNADTQIEIVMASSGSRVAGAVRDAKGGVLSDAVVALVPDGPLREAGFLYRTSVSDVKGAYELRGIAPGDYRVFAWPDLEGAAYRNAEFMKPFEDRGKPVRVEKGARLVLDVTALD